MTCEIAEAVLGSCQGCTEARSAGRAVEQAYCVPVASSCGSGELALVRQTCSDEGTPLCGLAANGVDFLNRRRSAPALSSLDCIKSDHDKALWRNALERHQLVGTDDVTSAEWN